MDDLQLAVCNQARDTTLTRHHKTDIRAEHREVANSADDEGVGDRANDGGRELDERLELQQLMRHLAVRKKC